MGGTHCQTMVHLDCFMVTWGSTLLRDHWIQSFFESGTLWGPQYCSVLWYVLIVYVYSLSQPSLLETLQCLQYYLLSLHYPLVIKHGWFENPRINGGFNRNITAFYGPFSIAMFDYQGVDVFLSFSHNHPLPKSLKELPSHRLRLPDLLRDMLPPRERSLLCQNRERSTGYCWISHDLLPMVWVT